MPRANSREWYDRGQDPGARVVKICKACGVTFHNTKRESPANWLPRLYCSRDCWRFDKNKPMGWRRWTAEENEILFDAYKAGGWQAAARLLDRSKTSIQHQIRKLGISPGRGHAVEMARRKANGFRFFQPADEPEIDFREIRSRIAEARRAKIAKLRSQ